MLSGSQNTSYISIHLVLIGLILCITLFHIYNLKIETTGEILCFYIIMLEIIGISYEYFG